MTDKKTPKKPLKDVNSADRTYFMRVTVMFLQYGLIALPLFLYKFGWKGLFFWLLICLSLAVMVEFFTNTIGTVAGRLYTGRKGNWTKREKLEGNLSAVRVQKMKGNYETAMIMVESVIAQDPEYAEAIFIKAQLLYEVYKDRHESLKCLNSVIELTQQDEPVHRWAVALKKDIDG